MAVALVLVAVLLACTAPFVQGWSRAADYWAVYYPIAGFWMKLGPLLWAVTLVLWFNVGRWWLLKRRADKRKAEAQAAKTKASAPLSPLVAPVAVQSVDPVAPPPTAAVQVVQAVAAPKRTAAVLAATGRVAVATYRFVEDKTSSDKRKERYRIANFARVVAQDEASKRLKKPPQAQMLSKKGRVPLYLVSEAKGEYVLTNQHGEVVHRLLSKTLAMAKQEMLGY